MSESHSQSARDLIGYGRRPPHPRWPGEARIAVQFVMNYEEGSEYSIPDGDGFTETALTEAPSPVAHGTRDLAAESVYEFGSRVGFWRIMGLFAERKLPLTVFGVRARARAQSRKRRERSSTRVTTCAATAGAGSSTGSSPKTRSANTSRWP